MKQLLSLLLTLLVTVNISVAQQRDYELTHEMSAEEAKFKHLIGKDFYPTMPAAPPVRMVAEFERMQAVLIAYEKDNYHFGLPLALIAEMSEDCIVLTIVENQSSENYVIGQYQANGVNMSNCEFIQAPIQSFWTRDYGPWFVVDGNNEVGICNFPYNRPRPSDNDIPIRISEYYNVELYGMELVTAGGNWMCDGYGMASSSDLIIEENLNLSVSEIEDRVYSYLGVHTYNILIDPLGDYIKHIDCWGKYLDVDKVLVGQVPENDPRYDDYEFVANYFAQQISSWGTPYQVFRVFSPGETSTTPPTPYTNSLILNEKVFVPQTGNSYDDDALQVYENAMPGYEIIGIPYYDWIDSDALHCRAKGVADLGMLFIKHFPLLGNVHQLDPFEINCKIIPYSGETLYPDSLLIYYKVDGGAYTTSSLYHVSGFSYSGDIPVQPEGSVVEYYLHAADESGRSEEHPFIGAADPHVFTVTYPLPDVTVYPDTLLFEDFMQCIDGLPAIVKNNSDSTVSINHINNEGYDQFYWYIDPWNINLPYDLASGDSLILNVFIGITTTDLISYLQDTLFVETDASIHSVYIMVDSTLVVGDLELANVNNIQMQVFPNPVNSNSRIEFQISFDAEVSIKLFDIYGKEAGTILERDMNAGSHSIRLNATKNLKGGIYFIRMLVDEKLISRKILIMD